MLSPFALKRTALWALYEYHRNAPGDIMKTTDFARFGLDDGLKLQEALRGLEGSGYARAVRKAAHDGSGAIEGAVITESGIELVADPDFRRRYVAETFFLFLRYETGVSDLPPDEKKELLAELDRLSSSRRVRDLLRKALLRIF
jgi:hypothetical protein